jgi:hypothetical protein
VGAVVADLDPAVAERIAKRLRIVEGFPFGEDPIAGVAECLVRWCKGSPTDPGWTPEDQADTLVSNAIDAFAIGDEGFEAWTGIKQLRRVFNDSFDGGSVGNTGKPVEHQVWTSRREPLCKGCNDTGFTIEDGKDGNTYARPCANCRGKVAAPVPEFCKVCGGKETVIVEGKREHCPACSTPEKRDSVLGSLQLLLVEPDTAKTAPVAKTEPKTAPVAKTAPAA